MYWSIEQSKWIAGTPLFVCIGKIVCQEMAGDSRYREGGIRLRIVEIKILYVSVLSGSLRI